MLYCEFIDKIKNDIIIKDENTEKYFVRPDCEYVIVNSGFKLSDITDFADVTIESIIRHMKLECEKLNAQQDQSFKVMQWLYSVISTVVDPSMIEVENSLFEKLKEAKDIKHKTENNGKVLPFKLDLDLSKRKP